MLLKSKDKILSILNQAKILIKLKKELLKFQEIKNVIIINNKNRRIQNQWEVSQIIWKMFHQK